ncbi:hypothetical protein [Kribbella deserti]|uniref:Tetrapyrrole biosynthesis glutamyl-tRNA reductase dimerisation domain-containing protein n=1 Tax=Kribbella deserti TaxID=1926257 RepID=A0ABV6QF05_9ACTN
MLRHPLSEQCTATSKRTGLRCQLTVIGGGPCFMHGGKAPQVVAKREARIAVWEAQQRQAPIEVRDPADALLAAAETADELMQRLRRELAEHGTLSPALLTAVGEWLDRSSRLNKTVLDARIDERRTRINEAQGVQIATVLRDVLQELGHDASPGSEAAQVVGKHLRLMTQRPALVLTEAAS